MQKSCQKSGSKIYAEESWRLFSFQHAQPQQQFKATHNAIASMSFTSTNMAGELGKIHVPIQPLEETLAKLTVPELQQRLKKRGLKKSGVKAKLIQRLKEVCFINIMFF